MQLANQSGRRIEALRVVVSADAVRPGPVRELVGEPILEVAGFEKNCQECHALFSSPVDAPLRLNQHRNIVQAHGMNDQCFNCHDRANRDRLALPRGRTLSFDEAEKLKQMRRLNFLVMKLGMIRPTSLLLEEHDLYTPKILERLESRDEAG